MEYNEKVERYAPKLGRKNLLNGLSCPPFVYMEDSDEGMWVHYAKYCENIAHHKYKRCLAMARMCEERSARYDVLQEVHDLDWRREIEFNYRWYKRWLELAKKFKEAK